jgi:hypothetical protein
MDLAPRSISVAHWQIPGTYPSDELRSGAEECVRVAVMTSDKIVAEEGALTVTNASFFVLSGYAFVQRQRSLVSPSSNAICGF